VVLKNVLLLVTLLFILWVIVNSLEGDMKKKIRLDVERLVNDCGGVNLVQVMTTINRTAVYSIFRRGRMTSDQLAEILATFPSINVRDYVVTK
jgi:hypothetical protein